MNIAKRLECLINNENTGHQNFNNYSLNDIKYLLKSFDNPHKKIKTIHIAGTNGKGSVAFMLNSILVKAGLKTGLYTSPHLIKINERIKINNKIIPSQKLNLYINEIFDLLNTNKNLYPTYFDVLTFFAFRYFYEQNVDIAIIETGLGGRLDSTNVITPLISIITDISIDHINVLGKNLKKIATEKAGIIKKNSIVITSNRKKDILEIISKRSKELSSELYIFKKDFYISNINTKPNISEINYDYSIKKFEKNKFNNIFITDILLKIPGDFQAINSSLAITASILLKSSGFNIKTNDIIKGLRKVKIPGRFHIISKNPLIIFDPAHNPDALKATISTLKIMYPDKNHYVVASFMIDKNHTTMIRMIQKRLTTKILYYELDDERCFKISKVQRNKNNLDYADIIATDNVEEMNKFFKNKIKENSLILITGSFRLFNIAKKLSAKLKMNPE